MPTTDIVVHESSPLAKPAKLTPVFERIVHIDPAHDCIVNQPCQLPEIKPGNRACQPPPSGTNHGRGDCTLLMTLRSAIADITFAAMTGWSLPETPHDKRLDVVLGRSSTRPMPRGAYVAFHSVLPSHDGQDPIDNRDCDRWPGRPCYADTGYLLADAPAELLARRGSDAVWEWLEKLHSNTFKGR